MVYDPNKAWRKVEQRRKMVRVPTDEEIKELIHAAARRVVAEKLRKLRDRFIRDARSERRYGNRYMATQYVALARIMNWKANHVRRMK